VLALGFQGMFGAGSAHSRQREEAFNALNERVPPLDSAVSLVVHKRRLRHYSLLRSTWFWVGISVAVTALAWWGGHVWLQALLAAQLPELHS
jgi:type VI secretion system protein ImpK